MRASVLAFFVYAGVEAGIGLWGTSLLVITRGVSPPLASLVLSGYWGMLVVGRFLLGALAERIGPARLLSRCCWTAVGALLVTSVPGLPLVVTVAALGTLGLALAPIYPLLMHDTLPASARGPRGTWSATRSPPPAPASPSSPGWSGSSPSAARCW